MEEHFEGPAIVDSEGNISLPGLSEMLSAEEPAKGASTTRVWGVKDHVERLPEDYRQPPEHPFDWHELYEMEKQKTENLTRDR